MKIGTRDLSLVAIFAALYAALVYVFAPISFMALQFRVAGVLRPAIAKKWILAVGYAIGVVIGNFYSPNSYEVLFMPVMSLIAGLLGHILAKKFGKNYFICGAVIATIIPFAVAWMLFQVYNEPIVASLPYLFISEQVVCLIGSFIFQAIETRFKWWQS